jgi:hypothetical protein
MAKQTLMATTALSATRIADIADAIYQTCATGNMDFEAVVDAKAEVDTKADVANSKREGIMVAIAQLSEAGQWTPKEVDLAAKDAIKQHNNVKTKKAMETFIGEIKHAAHPDVRDHVPALISIRTAAWQAETEQLKIDPDGPRPLRKCFKRAYHALIQAMGACEKGNVFRTVDDMVNYAIANDPDQDAAAVYKKITALQKTLAAYFVDYPADDLGYAADTLGKLTFNDLKMAQDRRNAETNPQPATVVAATPAAAVVTPPAAEPQPDVAKLTKAFTVVAKVPPATAVAQPAAPVDMLDSMLDDNLQLQQAS